MAAALLLLLLALSAGALLLHRAGRLRSAEPRGRRYAGRGLGAGLRCAGRARLKRGPTFRWKKNEAAADGPAGAALGFQNPMFNVAGSVELVRGLREWGGASGRGLALGSP